jgi:hypothetical protein
MPLPKMQVTFNVYFILFSLLKVANNKYNFSPIYQSVNQSINQSINPNSNSKVNCRKAATGAAWRLAQSVTQSSDYNDHSVLNRWYHCVD